MKNDKKHPGGMLSEVRDITKRVKLTKEENEQLDKLVEESGLTWSQYVRERLFGGGARGG